MRWIKLLAAVLAAGLLAAPTGALRTEAAQSSEVAGPSPGVMLAWGNNGDGQLGIGISANRNTPVSVHLPPGVMVSATAAGGGHSLALTSDGKVLAWGNNNYGQLGDDSNTSRSEPVPVHLNLHTDVTVTAIAAGRDHSLALTSNGKVFAWGANYSGQLGCGTTADCPGTNSNTPVQVHLPDNVTVTAIAAGWYHSLARTSEGKLFAWGDNSSGQLGCGTTADCPGTNSNTPVQVHLPDNVTVTAIAAGGEHSLALALDETVLAWGDNFYGQLGNGTNDNKRVPFPVQLPHHVAVNAIAVGEYHSMARTSEGQVYAWGSNEYGQLGDGSTGPFPGKNVPVQVHLPADVTVTAIAAGRDHSLARTSDGKVLAWGYNFFGNLGKGTSGVPARLPVWVQLPVDVTIDAIAAGHNHNLALTLDGKVLAWGYNHNGELGIGTSGSSASRNIPVRVHLPVGVTVTATAGGYGDSLALTSDGEVLAWGKNNYGQLGIGTSGSSQSRPVPVHLNLPPGVTVTAIAAGEDHSLALTSQGQVYAWGSNRYGQLGDGAHGTADDETAADKDVPVAVHLPPETTVTAIAAGWDHSMARTSDGKVLAWGWNGRGQLGTGTNDDKIVPVPVQLPGSVSVSEIAANGYYSLALTSDGQHVLAWGYNFNGQLGCGTHSADNPTCPATFSYVGSSVPVEVDLPHDTTVTAIAAGYMHGLALTSNGHVLAWGWNHSGQLGDGTNTMRNSPVEVDLPPGVTVTEVAGGGNHSLALTSGGHVLAWGSAGYGQLGNRTNTSSNEPVDVSLPPLTTVTAIAAGWDQSLAIRARQYPLPIGSAFVESQGHMPDSWEGHHVVYVLHINTSGKPDWVFVYRAGHHPDDRLVTSDLETVRAELDDYGAQHPDAWTGLPPTDAEIEYGLEVMRGDRAPLS